MTFPRRSVVRRWISVGNRWSVRDEQSTGFPHVHPARDGGVKSTGCPHGDRLTTAGFADIAEEPFFINGNNPDPEYCHGFAVDSAPMFRARVGYPSDVLRWIQYFYNGRCRV